jgi:hypothetical protein
VKGRTEFTGATADRIRVLLSQTRNAPRPQQKALRQQIRDMGFYISDWERPGTAFTVDDFDDMVLRGQIKIT